MSVKPYVRAISRALLAWTFLLVFALPRAQASTRIDLNGEWQFKTDPAKQGEENRWQHQLAESTETVHVPHTWNIGRYEDFEGTAWYFKKFSLPDEWRGKHVELHFGATFYKSRVWLNGVALGGHEGGHTAYSFDVTPHLKPVNFLAVEINNQPTLQSIPGWAMKLRDGGNVWYDWWHYGGIVRDVWLSVHEQALIRRQQIGVKIEGTTATIIDRIFLENHGNKLIRAHLSAKALDPDGNQAAMAFKAVTLAPGAQEETLSLQINPAKLWHFDHPNVYRMEVGLFQFGRGDVLPFLDSLTDNFGARTVEIRDRRLYLNGELVRLTGLTRHEESPW
jgi:beta-glucuronidase